MMLTRTVKKVFAGALVAVAMLASTAVTRAGSVIEYSLNGGATWTTLAGTINNSSFLLVDTTVGGIKVSAGASVGSNSPGDPDFGFISSSTLAVLNTNNSKTNILFAFGVDNFTQPVTPPQLLFTSSLGGSVTKGSSDNKISFASYIDQGNNLGSLALVLPTFGIVNPSPSITAVGSYKTDASTFVSPLSATYSVVQFYDLTLGAGAQVNFASTTTLDVPEPASMSILGVGLLGAAGYGIRRRKTQVSA